MSTPRPIRLFSIALSLLLTTSATSLAATDPPPTVTSATTTTAAQDEDDDAALVLAEPDFRLINLPTTLRLPRFKSNFDLTHRFSGNVQRGTFGHNASHLFGIDEGATVGFEYRFAVARHLELAAYRVSYQQTIQLYAKYDAIHQRGMTPISASLVVSSEAINNFQDQYAPAIGMSLSRLVGDVAAFYVVPTWVHHSAAATSIDRDTFYTGVGGRIRIRPTVYIAAEVSPRLSGYAPGKAEFGFALEKRAGGHMFQLNLSNTAQTTVAQIARGGTPQSLYLGFNLSRKFF